MKKKKLLFLIPIAVLAIVGGIMVQGRSKGPQALPVDFTTLKKTTIRNAISTDGTVKSTNAVNVYSELNYAVKEIFVEVGTRVNAGDVLCTLNSDTLTDDIQKNKLSILAAQQNAQQAIKVNQKQYNDDKSILEAGLNTILNQAQDAVDTAHTALTNAQEKLNDAKSHVKLNLNTELITAKSNYSSASTALSRAETDLRERKSELGSEYTSVEKSYNDALKKYGKADKDKNTSKDKLEKLRQDVLDCKDDMERLEGKADSLSGESALGIKRLRQNAVDAQHTFDTAEKNLAAAQRAVTEELSSFQSAVTSAQTNYNSAVKAQKAAQVAVLQGVQKDELALETSKAAANNAAQHAELQILQKQLGKCAITAPVSGTVTAVYAVKGSPATGLLFLIEDTNALELLVKIKEYDVNTIKEGMVAVIKSDSTRNDEYEGYLEKIAPAAMKESGDAGATPTQSSNKANAEFGATVLITSKETKLRIGMNAKANIIKQQKENVFSVPFEAVATNAQGKNIVYLAKAQNDGTYIAQEILVTMGLETDYEVEILGKDLIEHMQIITDAKQIKAGMLVMQNVSGTAASGPAKAQGAV